VAGGDVSIVVETVVVVVEVVAVVVVEHGIGVPGSALGQVVGVLHAPAMGIADAATATPQNATMRLSLGMEVTIAANKNRLWDLHKRIE
jgi:hypothetical protein